MAFDAGTIRTEADLDISAFQRNMAALQGAVNQVNKTMEGVKPAVPALDSAEVSRQANVIQTALSGVGKSLLGLPKGQVSLDIGDATKNVEGLTASLGGLGKQLGVVQALGGLGAVLGAGSLVAAAGTATVALVQLGAEWRSFNRDLTAGSGATGQALKDLQADFQALAAGTVGVSGSDLAKALPIIRGRLEETGAALRQTTADLVTFTRVMGGDFQANVQDVTKMFLAWGVALDAQHEKLNFLTSVAQLTGENVHELSQEMKQIAPVARALGLSYEETAALLVKFNSAGVDASDVMRALNKVAGDAAKQGIEGRVAWEAFLNIVANSPDDLKAAQTAIEAAGLKGGLALKQGLREGSLSMEDLIQRAKQAPGVLDQVPPAAKRLELALNAMRAALGPLGADILKWSQETLAQAIESLNGYGRAIDAFIQGPLHALTVGLIEAKKASDDLAARNAQADADLAKRQAAQSARARGEAPPVETPGLDTAVQATEIAHQLAAADAAAAEVMARLKQEWADTDAAAQKSTQSMAESEEVMGRLTGKADSLEKQLKKLSDVGQIEGLLTMQAQLKDVDEAINSLTDKSIAAWLVAERNMAQAIGESTGDWQRWDVVVATARQELENQQAAQEATKEAQRQANEELKKQQKIMQEVADVAGDQYTKRLETVAKTLLPGLTAETAITVKQLLLQGNAAGAAETALGAYGKGLQDLGPIHNQSQAEFDETTKKLDDLTKAADPAKLFRDELASRSKSVLDAVIGNLSAAEQAAVRWQAGSVGALDALSQKFQGLGGDATTFRAAMQAALSGSTEDVKQFTTAAQNAVKFLKTGAIPQVPAPPKDAVDAWADAMQQANQQLADASGKTSDALRKADETLAQETAQIQATLAQARADYARAVDDLNRQDQAARASFAAAAVERAAALSKVLRDLSRAGIDARADAETAIVKANDEIAKSYDEMAKSSLEAIQGLNEQAVAATEQWVAAQQAALTQLSASLTAIRQQEEQATLAFSRSLQEITEKGLIGPQTQEATNQLAIARLRLQQDFGLQEAGLSTAESAARGAFGRATTAADAQLKKQAEENAKALKKVLEELEKKRREAEQKQQQAIAEADEKLREKLAEIAEKQTEALQKAADEAKKAQEAEDKRQQELAEKRKELERKQQEAEAKAAREQEKADQKHADRVAEIRKDQEKEAEKFRKAMTEANKDLKRSIDALVKMGVEQNTIMKAILKRAGVEVQIDYKDLVIQETGVDFLKVGIQAAEKAMKAL